MVCGSRGYSYQHTTIACILDWRRAQVPILSTMAPSTASSSSRKRGIPIKVETSQAPRSKKTRTSTDHSDGDAVQQEDDNNSVSAQELKERFISLFSQEEYKDGLSNTQLKSIFGEVGYQSLVPIINNLAKESRLNMSKLNEQELFYKLVSEEVAKKFVGLDPSARLV